MKGFMKKILSAGLAFALVLKQREQKHRKQRLRRLKQSLRMKKIQYWFMEGLRVHSTGQRIISIIL